MSASHRQLFDDLVEAANFTPLEGWDFSFLNGRTLGGSLPWDYQQIASGLVFSAHRTLDIDTGGGEIFASFKPPRGSVAVEPYKPNLPVSTQRLEALGVEVRERTSELLPADDASFDLVLNRHGYLNLDEFYRVLIPGGKLLTQQVGGRNDIEFNEALGIPASVISSAPVNAQDLRDTLTRAGFVNCQVSEANISTRFLDVGAVVYQLRAIPWQAPGFDAVVHREHLWRIHEHIAKTGRFEVRSQRFLIRADKPVEAV
ncbi:class I SAM-dependent methyltransferase [Pseudarthrobacter sp. NS4]|uniref:class I SAM-dependent methyltransferase n=1 Tax=Pseudarthrobacter sp. NS4 TaxID=2973976 RepID=UPI002161BDD8|nr:class I SAM-dependent methyltransferase [Pseudarthrobacter sp. NS4]